MQNLNEIIDNAPSMLYKKEFAITPYGGAFLKNPEPAKAYVKEKIDNKRAVESHSETIRDKGPVEK